MLTELTDIKNCVTLFNKFSNSTVPLETELDVMKTNVRTAYSEFASKFTIKEILDSNKDYDLEQSNFVKDIYKVLMDALPDPIVIPPVPPPPLDLRDKDGNVYTTVVIGTQEWIIENLKTTTYADGTPIPNITINANVPNSLTSWSNDPTTPFNTFTSSGVDITSAIKTAGSYGYCRSNAVHIDATYENMGTVYFNFTLTLNSGVCPKAVLYKNGYAYSTIGFSHSGTEAHIIGWLIGETGDYMVGFMNSDAMDATNFSITGGQFYLNYVLGSWASDTTGAYCWYSNDIANKDTYGALYNWYAVDNGHGLAYFERGGIQETGWRIPLQTDFQDLAFGLGGVGVGAILKEIGLTHWNTPNTGAIDTYGFALRGAGNRLEVGGSFQQLKVLGVMWSSTAINANVGSAYGSAYNSAELVNYQYSKKYGYSIRCVRDI